MSNAEQAVLGIVGGIVGFFVGGPQGAIYGFQLGLLAGSALFPTQLPHLQGPRLGEGQQTVSTVGQPIPWVFGTQPVGGNIIWASPIREEANTEDVGGKGGPEQSHTTYTYFRSFAILLCEGPIGGLRRAWANGKVVYDARPQQEDEDADAYMERQAINSEFLSKVTIYLGTEDQMPDPTIESFKGVGNVHGYRGYAYIVLNDVQLKPEDGNRIPASWKFEVYEDGEEESDELVFYSNEVLYPWRLDDDPVNPYNLHQITRVVGGDSSGTEIPSEDLPDLESVASAKNALIALLSPDQRQLFNYYLGYDCGPANTFPSGYGGEAIGYTNRMGARAAFYNEAISVGLHYNSYGPAAYVVHRIANGSADDDLDEVGIVRGSNRIAHINLTAGLDQNCGAAVHARLAAPYGTADHSGADATAQDCLPDLSNCLTYIVYNDIRIQVTRLCQPPLDACIAPGSQSAGISGWAVVDGQLLPCGEWQRDESTTYRVLQAYTQDGDNNVVLTYPLNPARPLGHPEYDNQEFWEEHYEREVARGRMEAGLTYGVDYPVEQNFGYKLSITAQTADVNLVSLASIVSRICERVGLTEYDVSDLENDYIIGYQVARPMAARAAIEPLRQVGFFDVVESGNTLKFLKRGRAPVATLTSDDLGAHFEGEERPPAITTQKKLELELPLQIRVHFQNPERDYEPGEELSPVRFDTEAQSVLDIDLAVAIMPTKAAQIAEVLYRDTWASRWVHNTSVDQSRSDIEPADCILVPIDGWQQRMRVTALTERLPNLRSLELVRDDDGTYVSHAVGTTSQNTIQRPVLASPIEVVLLDLPPLSADHDDPGLYVAARPLLPRGTFTGATITRSADGDAFSIVGSVSTATPMGRLITAPPEGPSTIFDEGSTLRVELDYGELESRDEADVLDGANAAAIGDHGRWEIIQFKHATHVTGRIYDVSGLLRGRRGTEQYIGTAQPQDRFVMLSTGSITRIGLPISSVGVELTYRAGPTNGVSITQFTFTGYGVALKPFSPVHLSAERNDDGDITISWVRRDRLATDLDEAMSEEVEDYEVSILDANEQVIRVLSVSQPQAVYTASQQVTDFGSVQDPVRVRVAQISVAIGAGYYAEGEL